MISFFFLRIYLSTKGSPVKSSAADFSLSRLHKKELTDRGDHLARVERTKRRAPAGEYRGRLFENDACVSFPPPHCFNSPIYVYTLARISHRLLPWWWRR